MSPSFYAISVVYKLVLVENLETTNTKYHDKGGGGGRRAEEEVEEENIYDRTNLCWIFNFISLDDSKELDYPSKKKKKKKKTRR